MSSVLQIKVIPLKLFYYQTFFETWRDYHSKVGSPCLFMNIKKENTEMEKRKIFKRVFKMGYFNWLRVKTSNHLYTELSLGYIPERHKTLS